MEKSTGRWCITCSKVVKTSGGKVLGVCAADMYLDDIAEYVTNMKIGKSGYSFIIDNQGSIVIHPENYSFSANNEFSTENPLNLSNNFIEEILSNKNGISNIKLNNKDYYAVYNPLSTTNWFFIILIENDEIIEPINNIKNLIQTSAKETDSTLK